MHFENTLSFARERDIADPLRSFRERFFLPIKPDGEPFVYLCGNSLGLQPKTVENYIRTELNDWAKLGVEGHFHAQNPWLPYHEFLTDSSARLVGARPEEVVVMNSLSVNLHLMMVSFYRPQNSRFKIIIEEDAFPSDLYAVESQIRFHGHNPSDALIKLRPRLGEYCLRTEDIEAAIGQAGDSLSLVLIGGVNYYTGQAFDMEKITAAGHKAGAFVGFDLAHAAGNIELKLHDWEVDFACWCSYKYLNSGPGGVGGCFVHQRHITDPDLPRFAGWWGHDKNTRFKMGPEFHPIPTAEGWQLSNAPILAMASLRASLAIFEEAGLPALRQKSLLLTGYMEFLLQNAAEKGIKIITPSTPGERGCQLSLLTGENGRHIFDRLTHEGVICDWREPNVIRVAPVPLYNTFEEVWLFTQLLLR
ncbi:MAG: kynureninase [Bacteroidia bacterium]|nr:kynureninase [Bacteroidia bacterium]